MNRTVIGALVTAVLAAMLILPVGCGDQINTNSPLSSTQPAAPPPDHLIGFMGARQDDSDFSVFVMDVDGANQARLAPALLAPLSPGVWSPDGTALAYVDRDSSSHKYWFSLIGANGENQRKVTDLPESVPWSWSWSADGKTVLMLCATGGQAEPKPEGGVDERHYFDIFTMDIETGEMKRLTDSKNVGKSAPVSSPDARKIAFSGAEHDPNTWSIVSYGIYVMNLDGTSQAKLLDSPRPVRSFEWSPDGRRIAYSSYEGKIETESVIYTDIYVLDVQTGSSTDLTNSANTSDEGPLWSPDGTKIVYCSGVAWQMYHLRVMNADGTGATDLYDLSDYPQGFPSWSPDGNSILFTDRQNIYSIGVDGTGLKTVFDGKGTYRDILFPVWLAE